MAILGTGPSAQPDALATHPLIPRPAQRSARPALVHACVAAGLAAGLLAAGTGPSYAEATGSEPLVEVTPVLDPLERDLYLPFNDLDSLPVIGEVHSSSDVRVAVSSAAGGEVLPGPDRFDSGHSLRLEPFRPDRAAQPAVVVVEALGGDDPTDPRQGDFSFGAEFVLDAHHGTSPTDNGDNLVQRGLFGEDAQYKIQLDDARPTCRVAGSEGSVTVRASERVDTGEWYRVRCRRVGDEVTLRVVTSLGEGKELRDYVERGRTGSVSFAGAGPFSIGGKVDTDGDVLTADSDQFNGLVDDVFFRKLS